MTVDGLQNGRTYFFVVTAANRLGEGEASQELAATPMPNGLPAPPGLG